MSAIQTGSAAIVVFVPFNTRLPNFSYQPEAQNRLTKAARRQYRDEQWIAAQPIEPEPSL